MRINQKEDIILEIFFQHPSTHFRFKEIVKIAGLHKDNVNNWLIRLQDNGFVRKIKTPGKFPYYIANHENNSFKNRKKIYALSEFYESGFLDTLSSLKNAKAVIIFGSFSRSDWHKGSDIDLFIYGNTGKLDLSIFEKKLCREIELFSYKDKKDLKKANPFLMKNILAGYYVKGSMSF